MKGQAAINQAVDYLAARGVSVPPNVAAMAKSREIKQAAYYQAARAELWSSVYDAVYDFMSSTNPRTGPNTRMRIAVTEMYTDTGYMAYEDGGGSFPLDDETQNYISLEISNQNNFVDQLFQRLLELRREGDFDPIQEAFRAADRWASGLDGFYNAVRMKALGNKMVTWSLGRTEQHCETCARLDGQRHRASWFSRRGYYPRKPGSNTDCGGYRCDCSLSDDQGNEVTI